MSARTFRQRFEAFNARLLRFNRGAGIPQIRTAREQLAERVLAGVIGGIAGSALYLLDLALLNHFLPGLIAQLFSNMLVGWVCLMPATLICGQFYTWVLAYIDRHDGVLLDLSPILNRFRSDGDDQQPPTAAA